MTIRVIIFACDRGEMLLDTLRHLNRFDSIDSILVLDDASKFRNTEHKKLVTEYRRNKTREGKFGFFRQWQRAMEYCRQYPADLVIFMPDDFERLDIGKIIQLHCAIVGGTGETRLSNQPYAFNIINDGRTTCWTPLQLNRRSVGGISVNAVGFVDCGFFCNPQALARIVWNIEKIPDKWFDHPGKSSGVGWQLSRKFFNGKVTMFQPIRSLAYHGDHQSLMHPNERKKNPLISR